MRITQAQAREFLEKARSDPAWFLRTVFQEEPWEKQVEILESVRDNPQTAVKSCHATGKSYTASRTALWFAITHPGSIVITTAPSNRQVKNIIWKEIRAAVNKVEERTGGQFSFGGKLLSQELRFADDWFMIGFTAPEHDPDKFQGYHAEHILVILDEACGISPMIYEAVDGILTSTGSRRLEIGNPTDPNTPFAKSFKTKGINKITVSAFDTPNMTVNGITQEDIENETWREKIKEIPYPTLVTPEWVSRVYKRHGKNSQFYLSRVLAVFPDQGTDTLIPLSFIERCQNVELSDECQASTLGVDVARYGTNETVIYHKKGKQLRKYGSWAGLGTMEVCGKIIQAVRETGAYYVNVDAIGVGGGVCDRLIEMLSLKQEGYEEYKDVPNFTVNPVNVGVPSNKPQDFMNLKVELWFHFRDLLEKAAIDLDPDDEDLEQELCSLRYMTTSTGKARMELKEDMIRRGEQSPDHADAACLAVMPTAEQFVAHSVDNENSVIIRESSFMEGFL